VQTWVSFILTSTVYRDHLTFDMSTERWLTTYIDANPNRSTYGFCIDPKHPGYFYLCFKASRTSRVNAWVVRVIPQAFELMKSPYPDMRALCNGFKLRYQSEMMKKQGGR
jgi:transcription elongation factor SPT6